MEIECSGCKEKIEGSDYFECDGCSCKYHIKCNGILKKDLSARQSSKRLKLFCEECEKKPESMVLNNVIMALKYIYKIDLSTQMHEKSHAQACYDIERMKDKIELIAKIVAENKSTGIHPNDKMSYAGAVKKSVNLPVFIKPKEKQNSMVTKDEIQNKISFKEIKSNGLKKARDGAIVINCPSQSESMKVKQIVQDKVGEKYTVEIPKAKRPRLKILNLTDEMTKEEIVENLKVQNELLENTDFEVKAVIERKKGGKFKVFDVVIEAEESAYNMFIMMKVVILGWDRCRVVEHTHILRCYNCCGFSHITKDCKNKKACSKCGGEHDRKDCTSGAIKCINCANKCEKFKLKLDVAFDSKCEIYKRKLKFIQSKYKLSSSD